jgi:hypothetical protein
MFRHMCFSLAEGKVRLLFFEHGERGREPRDRSDEAVRKEKMAFLLEIILKIRSLLYGRGFRKS